MLARHAVFVLPDGTRYLGEVVGCRDDERVEMRPLWRLGDVFAVDVAGVGWSHVVAAGDLLFPGSS